MFANLARTAMLRVRLAAARIRAFALLEDAPSPPTTDPTGASSTRSYHQVVERSDHAAALEPTSPPIPRPGTPLGLPPGSRDPARAPGRHPHRMALAAPTRARRPGVPPPRPAVCITPVQPGTRDRINLPENVATDDLPCG